MVEAKEKGHNAIEFRKADVRDSHRIACLDEAAHPSASESNQIFNVEMINDLLEEYEQNGENYSFIAYKDSEPIGFMLMTAHSSMEVKEYRIASWSVIPNHRSFQTASAMVKYALSMGGGRSSYRAWAREKTVIQSVSKPGIREWLAKQGYEVHIDQDSQMDSGGEPHVSVRLTPIHSD